MKKLILKILDIVTAPLEFILIIIFIDIDHPLETFREIRRVHQ